MVYSDSFFILYIIKDFSREFSERVSLCFTAVKLQKRHKSQEISSEQNFCLFIGLCQFFPEI